MLRPTLLQCVAFGLGFIVVSLSYGGSIECRKAKTHVINLANHNGHRQSNEPIKTRSKHLWRKARENVIKRVVIGSNLLLIESNLPRVF